MIILCRIEGGAAVLKALGGKQLYKTIGTERNYAATSK